MALSVVVAGCTPYAAAKTSSNTLRAALHEAAPLLEERCLAPYRYDATMTPQEATATLRAYDRSGCSRYLRAYDDARMAHVALTSVVGAHEVGACVNNRIAECNMPRALLEAAKATAAVVDAVRALRAER